MPGDKTTRVLLLRHAETTAPHLFHGAESDVGLSERGHRQSEAIAPILAAEDPAAVVCSAMRRAVETATPIARACNLPLTIEPGLHERRIGSLCGQPCDASRGPWAETLRPWRDGETTYATEGAESFEAIRDQILPIWYRLADAFSGQTYVVVAHRAVIKVLLLSLDVGFIDWNAFRCPNLGIHDLVQRELRWNLVESEVTA